MNLYSNAFNFSSYVSGSVDVRTGQYGMRICLATLFSKGPLEASRAITLSFSMFRQDERGGVGPGWGLSNTEFDVSSFKLNLLSGEQYKTDGLPPVGGALLIRDRKLKNLVVKRPDPSTLHVIYQDGIVEILQRTGSTVPYRIVAMLFENGERLTFSYGTAGFLERILSHEQEELLVLTYSGGRLSAADTRIDGARYARIGFAYTNSRLTSVTAPYDRSESPGTAAYTFVYRAAFRNGLVPLMRVRSPMGGDELITYAENGHQYANNRYIPRVVSWVRTPASAQPAMSRTYVYSSGKNFTGYPYTGGFREDEDNLYLVGSAYDYWTEETSRGISSEVLSVTRTTYNKFHLLTEEQVLREGTRATTTFAYNIVPGLFPAQPANLHIPKTVTKRFEWGAGGPPREEIEHITTDDYGNELSRTAASGVRTEYSYYPIDGEPGKCPADPHALFQRYVKQERLIPAGGALAPRLTEYTHTRIPQTGSSYFVLQASSISNGVDSTLQTYYEAPVALAGRLKSMTNTIDGLSLASEFSYSITGDNIVETRRQHGREGQWLESVRTLSLVNRRLLSMTRDGGSALALAFDVSGRLVAETVSPGKLQQAERRYAYHFATQTRRAHLISTDAQGNQSITYFDGLGRRVSEAQLMSDGLERATGAWLYNAQGWIQETVQIDYLTDGPRSLKSTHTYNRWGNASRVTQADGTVVIDEYDPQLNLKIEGVEGGARLRTWFNDHNQPIKVERLDTADNSVEVESRTYDGLGRCLSVLDISNNLTEFTYDPHSRVLTTLQKPADGTPPRLRRNDYAPGTSGEKLSALSVDGKRLGARNYDSLGRMTSQIRGMGQPTTWEYEAGWIEPVVRLSPGGGRQILTYDKELDSPTRIETTGHPVITYRHDPVSGAVIHAETGGLIHKVFNGANGYPEKEIQTANGKSLTTLYGYSPGGRLLYQTAADGQRSQLEYDEFGRFQRMTTATLVIEQGYDTFGRPQTLTTAHGSTRVVTRIAYDSLGREAERRFEQGAALLQVMISTYHPNNMLATRFLRDANNQLVIGETFSYDAYLRLTNYRCEGLEQPQDHRGRRIVGQDFGFDSLDNIIHVVTSFSDGTQDTCERFFTGTDPTQLTRVTHTHPVQDFTLTYDAAGNVQAGPSGHVYRFNALEQLVEVRAGAFTYSYQYDAEARQVLASRDTETPVMLAYSGERLDTLVEGDKTIRYHTGEDQVVARTGGVEGQQLHVNDASGSVRGLSAPGQAHIRRHYTPYGDAHIDLNDGKPRTLADLQFPAFNGQRLDAAVNLYFLGNGERAYDPDLMVFLQADPLSPFDEGGLNSYAYCAGNPINMLDPSGLFPTWLRWVLAGAALALGGVALVSAVVGIAAVGLAAATTAQLVSAAGTAMGFVGSTLGVTALTIDAVDKANGWDRSSAIQALGWASFAFSIAAMGVSVYSSWNAASSAYGAAKAGAMRSMVIDARMSAGLRAATKVMTGRTFKFGSAKAPTAASKAFGSLRAGIRMINLMRSLTARYNALDAYFDEPDDASSPQGHEEQPQPQPELARLTDMQDSVSRYYQTFRDDCTRIRRPILSGMYAGTS
ncbi:RHS repeat-associated core domain-containing protein [Pseudomonas sp. MUP55]|uniref:RHS repeat domain-containing protein n=1 Tax=Pseudomonas sp. MUP55 TaxID=3087234 RepID=UPI002A5A2664|nr:MULTISPECIES: RHS repeat-associated core domain-containing protein [unclassified Pseudomonas]WPN93779.1 RHS repeat-associated core domain-containing protein [Pseudomonas sp. MUP56]WPN99305.1 RHS repeat-associated core domain-containing protein [Pseudomonas sp. MUP55]